MGMKELKREKRRKNLKVSVEVSDPLCYYYPIS